tara:strand:+ start:196 stop:864 length:669 start_codon:yes stop_codon:yes gene_type:complete
MKKINKFFLLFGINISIILIVYILIPSAEPFLAEENSLIENLSAIFFGIASLTGFIFFLKSKYRSFGLLIISAFGMLGFMDEISFGKSFIDYDNIYIYNKKIDGIHDFLDLAYNYSEANNLLPFLFFISLIFIFTTLYLMNKEISKAFNTDIKKPLNNPIIRMIFIIFLIIVFSQLIDLGAFDIQNFNLIILEESLEMNAGLALIFLTFIFRDEIKHKNNPI